MVNIVPITSSEFSDRRWRRFKQMTFAQKDTVAPLSVAEAPRAILSMPVGFIQKNGQYGLVGLQGLETESSLMVDQSGRWVGGYIPNHYFCHPFQLRKNQAGEFVLCIDEDSDLLTSASDEEAEPFFDDEGKPAKLVSDVLDYLRGHLSRLDNTARICKLLAEHRLIKPWPLRVDTSKGSISLEALYCVDEERMNNLSATALKELRNGDGLTLAYAQLFSMLNVHLLVKQLDSRGSSDGKNIDQIAEIDFENSDSGGTISFDNL